jgi:hypothetical protein
MREPSLIAKSLVDTLLKALEAVPENPTRSQIDSWANMTRPILALNARDDIERQAIENFKIEMGAWLADLRSTVGLKPSSANDQKRGYADTLRQLLELQELFAD